MPSSMEGRSLPRQSPLPRVVDVRTCASTWSIDGTVVVVVVVAAVVVAADVADVDPRQTTTTRLPPRMIRWQRLLPQQSSTSSSLSSSLLGVSCGVLLYVSELCFLKQTHFLVVGVMYYIFTGGVGKTELLVSDNFYARRNCQERQMHQHY